MTSPGSPPFEMIPVSKVTPNRINPRGPNVRENDQHRENLRESIAQFGILVPLVVRRMDEGKYELVDGERRYWAAVSLKLTEVPAYIIDGTLTTKALLQRMFQIHMNRDQWDAVQQCKASEDYYASLVQRHKEDVDNIIKDFSNFTGTDRRTARNRIQFLRWPRDVKTAIYEDSSKHESYWYVVEIEDKIVEPALKNYPEYFERVKADDVRRFLYKKWEAQAVKAAVEVRQAGAITRSKVLQRRKRREIIRILDHLVKSPEITYEDAYDEFARRFPELVEPRLPTPRRLYNLITRLSEILAQYEPQYLQTYTRRAGPKAGELLDVVRDLIVVGQAFLRRFRA